MADLKTIKIVDLPPGALETTDYFLKVRPTGEHEKVTGQNIIDTIKAPLVQEVADERIEAQVAAQNAETYAAQAEQSKNDAVLAQNPLADWRPDTNSPALTATPPAEPDGSWYDLTETGNAPFAGDNFTAGTSLKKGGRLVIKTVAGVRKFYYRGPADRSMELSQIAINAAASANDQVAETLRAMAVLAHNRTDNTGVVIAEGNSSIVQNETTGVITTTGSTDTVDSRAEYWETDLTMKANQKVYVDITIGAQITSNPAVGLGLVGGPVALYRKDGSIGYITRGTGAVSLPYAVAAGSAWITGDIIRVTLFNTGGWVNAEFSKNGVVQFGYTFPSSVLEGSRVLLFQRGSLSTTQKLYTAAEVSSVQKTVKSVTDPFLVASKNLLPKKFSVGSYGSTGAVVASTTWKRSSNLIPVKPNTTYLLKDIDTIFPGNEYDASGVRVRDIVANNPTTPYTSVTFTTGATTYALGINIQSAGRADTTNTAMLIEGLVAPATYEEYGQPFVDGNKVKGVATSAQITTIQNNIDATNASLATTNTKVVAQLTTSKNIADPALAVAGDSYYMFSTGAIGSTAGYRRYDYIPIDKLKGPWLNVQNVATAFIGNFYDAAHAKISSFGTNTGTKYFGSAMIPDGAVYFGMNYQSTGLTANPLTVMVYYSAVEQTKPTIFEDYAPPAYKVPAIQVSGLELLSPIYYEFSPTGGSGVGQFKVYCRYPGTNMYNGYLINHTVDAPTRSDLWRIMGADIYIRTSAGQMIIDASKKILHTSENEFAYQIKSTADHTGGYHGDEVLSFVQFVADGVPLSIAGAIAMTACNEFYLLQRADTYSPADVAPTPTVVAAHTKRTTFTSLHPGYKTTNLLEIAISVILYNTYEGLACIGLAASGVFYSKRAIPTNAVQDDVIKLNELIDRDGEITYYNATTRIGCTATSRFKKVKQNGADATAAFLDASTTSVWDRTSDTKYYHRIINTDKAFVAGDVIETEMEVKYFYSK